MSGTSDAERLTELFSAHVDAVYRVARRLSRTAADAHDLVQDTYLRAAQSLARIPVGEIGERAWLVRVLLNIRKDQWRKASVRRRFAAAAALSPVQPGSPEGGYIDSATIWRALDELTPRRRAIVTLVELDGLSTRDVATLLGTSAVTVRWHLSRGRKELLRAVTRSRSDAHEPTLGGVENGGSFAPGTIDPRAGRA
jgi:RNA polymerase sigma-70 factor (ECF subfamily)